ncbi:MAG: hypothetical protein ACXVBW_15945, partial [Bdellovibrionota bacterium]
RDRAVLLAVDMGPLEDRERQLLERLAAEGKATKLFVEDLPVAKSLVSAGLLFLVGNNELYAIITPKGRRLLAILERKPPKPPKPPIGFLDQ